MDDAQAHRHTDIRMPVSIYVRAFVVQSKLSLAIFVNVYSQHNQNIWVKVKIREANKHNATHFPVFKRVASNGSMDGYGMSETYFSQFYFFWRYTWR